MPPVKRDSAHGSVLLMGLWALSGLVGLVVAQGSTLHWAWRLWERDRFAFEAASLAEKGVMAGRAQIEADEERGWDAPSELWARPQKGEEEGRIWTETITDGSGFLNVNTASWTVIAHLPHSTVNIAEALCARRGNQPFQSLAELLFVEGITPKLLEQWDGLIRVIGQKEVNLNTALPGVLEALGLPDSTIHALVQWRNGPDGIGGTNDDRVFRHTSEISPIVSDFLKPEEVAVLMNLVNTGQLTVRSNCFRMSATGQAGPTQKIITVFVERQSAGIPSRIRSWHETTASTS